MRATKLTPSEVDMILVSVLHLPLFLRQHINFQYIIIIRTCHFVSSTRLFDLYKHGPHFKYHVYLENKNQFSF
jgi:hypothetical protein